MGVRDGEDMAECMAGGVGGGSGGGTWEFGGAQGVRQCGCAWLGGRTRMSRLCAMGGEAHGGGCTWVTGPGGGSGHGPQPTPLPPPVLPVECRFSPQQCPHRHASPNGHTARPSVHLSAWGGSAAPRPPSKPPLSDEKQRWGRRWLLGGRFHPLSPAPFCPFRGENKRGCASGDPHPQPGGGGAVGAAPPGWAYAAPRQLHPAWWGWALRFPRGWGSCGAAGQQGRGAPGPVIASSPGCRGMGGRGCVQRGGGVSSSAPFMLKAH